MGTALSVASTALAVFFAAFMAAYCLRLIGPSCTPARDPAPWHVNDGVMPGRVYAQSPTLNEGDRP